jgi:hypothetical protein
MEDLFAGPLATTKATTKSTKGAGARDVLDQAEAQGFADALDAISRRQGSQAPGMEAGVARSLQQLRQQGGMRADPTTDRRVSRASELDAAIEALPSELQGQALRNVPAERLGLKPSRIVRPAALTALIGLAGRNDAASRSLMNMVGIPEGTPIEEIEAAVHEAQDYNAKLVNLFGKIGEDKSALDLAARAAIMKQSLIQLSPSYAENPELDDTVAYLASQPHEEAAEFLKWLGTQDFRKHEKDLKRSYMHYTGLKGKGGGGIPETERRLNGARNELRTLLGSKARLGVKGPKLGSGRMYTAAESAELETIDADIVRLRGDINYYTERRDRELGRVSGLPDKVQRQLDAAAALAHKNEQNEEEFVAALKSDGAPDSWLGAARKAYKREAAGKGPAVSAEAGQEAGKGPAVSAEAGQGVAETKPYAQQTPAERALGAATRASGEYVDPATDRRERDKRATADLVSRINRADSEIIDQLEGVLNNLSSEISKDERLRKKGVKFGPGSGAVPEARSSANKAVRDLDAMVRGAKVRGLVNEEKKATDLARKAGALRDAIYGVDTGRSLPAEAVGRRRFSMGKD